jgi:hypothetical protein
MNRILAVLALAIGASAASNVAEVQGVLLDKMCSYGMEPRVVPGPRLEGGMMSAYVHTRRCALKPECQRSGYGVFTYDQKFLPFDQEGNRKALALLQSTKKDDDLRVAVRGDVQDGVMKVKELRLLE